MTEVDLIKKRKRLHYIPMLIFGYGFMIMQVAIQLNDKYYNNPELADLLGESWLQYSGIPLIYIIFPFIIIMWALVADMFFMKSRTFNLIGLLMGYLCGGLIGSIIIYPFFLIPPISIAIMPLEIMILTLLGYNLPFMIKNRINKRNNLPPKYPWI